MNEVTDNAVVADCIEYGINAGIVIACLGVLGYLSVRQNLPKSRRRPMTLGEALLAKHRKGFTLLEMLVSVAITMIVMLAIAQIFMYLSGSMDKGRALIEMSGQLRNVTHRLQQDLDGVTASTLPWTKIDAGDGYFEYIEGVAKDSDQPTTMQGDVDDVLAFTARSNGNPFAAAHNGGVAESELAEIIWWVHEGTLCRRILLIRPDMTGPNISAHSLADLTLRQNRALHNSTAFPHVMSNPGAPAAHEVVLANVVGFDVKAFDPRAPVRTTTAGTLVVPGDPGWVGATVVAGSGAYVDLNYANDRNISFYSGPPNAKSLPATPATYSTWPFFYEQDGIDQDDGGNTIDEATNGMDDNPTLTVSVADDVTEYETSPPYPHPQQGFRSAGLRGVQVRIRMNEPGSRQVRQSTVVADFLPE